MQLRSGRALPVPITDKFLLVRDKVNAWPTLKQAFDLSTASLDPITFMSHLHWLMSHLTHRVDSKGNVIPEDKKTNRLAAMAMAQSLLRVAAVPDMHKRYHTLAGVVIQKFSDCDHEVKEFDMPEFLEQFKMVWK